MVLTVANPVQAEKTSYRLDYKSTVKNCPTANRFSDEVSALIGFVPWHKNGAPLRIRFRREGGQVVASLELPDGTAKVLREGSCAALIPALVVATSMAVDSKSAPDRVRTQTPTTTTVATSMARVHVRSKKPGLTVSVITQRAVASGSNGGSASAVSYKDLCVTPCSFSVETGIKEVMVYGRGPTVIRKLNLQGGEDTFLAAESGSMPLTYGGGVVFLTGAVSVIVGGASLIADSDSSWALPTLLLGTGGVGLGYGMMQMGRSHLEVEEGPQGHSGATKVVRYSGTF